MLKKVSVSYDIDTQAVRVEVFSLAIILRITENGLLDISCSVPLSQIEG